MIKPRPVYLNLLQIRLPLPGWISILHRISGAALVVFGIPLSIYALQQSLGSEQAYAQLSAYLAQPLMKLLLLGLLWSFLHHFCAGVRYLLLDLEVGLDLQSARRSSVIVLVVSLLLTVIIAARLW